MTAFLQVFGLGTQGTGNIAAHDFLSCAVIVVFGSVPLCLSIQDVFVTEKKLQKLQPLVTYLPNLLVAVFLPFPLVEKFQICYEHVDAVVPFRSQFVSQRT